MEVHVRTRNARPFRKVSPLSVSSRHFLSTNSRVLTFYSSLFMWYMWRVGDVDVDAVESR